MTSANNEINYPIYYPTVMENYTPPEWQIYSSQPRIQPLGQQTRPNKMDTLEDEYQKRLSEFTKIVAPKIPNINIMEEVELKTQNTFSKLIESINLTSKDFNIEELNDTKFSEVDKQYYLELTGLDIEEFINSSKNLSSIIIKDLHRVDELRTRLSGVSTKIKDYYELARVIFDKLLKVDILVKKNTLYPVQEFPEYANLSDGDKLLFDTIKNNLENTIKELDFENSLREYSEILKSVKHHFKLLNLCHNLHSEVGQCGICKSERVTSAMIPCGHTYCQGCVNKNRYSCAYCRCDVRRTIKIFI
jgi:hypothetical protein